MLATHLARTWILVQVGFKRDDFSYFGVNASQMMTQNLFNMKRWVDDDTKFVQHEKASRSICFYPFMDTILVVDSEVVLHVMSMVWNQ